MESLWNNLEKHSVLPKICIGQSMRRQNFYYFPLLLSTYGMESYSMARVVLPFSFLDFEAVYLTAYWLKRSSFLINCTARFQMTMSQNFNVWKFFTEKLLAKMNRKHQKCYDKSSNLTTITTSSFPTKWKNFIRWRCPKSTALDSICCCWKMDGATSRVVGHLIWAGEAPPPRGKFRPLYILKFVISGANENKSSTGLAPRMTSVTWPSHVTWESSVFKMLIYTWRQMTSDDVIISGVESIVLLGDADVHIS